MNTLTKNRLLFSLGLPKIIAMDKSDTEIIDQLGGTSAVADIFDIKPPSVSEWRENGIPSARRQTLGLMFPNIVPSHWAPNAKKDHG